MVEVMTHGCQQGGKQLKWGHRAIELWMPREIILHSLVQDTQQQNNPFIIHLLPNNFATLIDYPSMNGQMKYNEYHFLMSTWTTRLSA